MVNYRKYIPQTFNLLLGIVLAWIILFPIVWGIALSFMNRVDALSTPPSWFFRPTLSHYMDTLIDGPYLGTLGNSLLIASGSTVLVLLLGIPAAYSLSRMRFKRERQLLASVLSIRMAPPVVIALPLFILFSRMGLINSHIAIILVHSAVNISLAVWIMKGFFDAVPIEIDQASALDGDSPMRTMMKQILPVSMPGLFITGFFVFVNSWNEYFLALMLTSYSTRPFTVAVPALATPHGTYWGQVTAIATIGLIPGIFIAIVARKLRSKELTAGSVW